MNDQFELVVGEAKWPIYFALHALGAYPILHRSPGVDGIVAASGADLAHG